MVTVNETVDVCPTTSRAVQVTWVGGPSAKVDPESGSHVTIVSGLGGVILGVSYTTV